MKFQKGYSYIFAFWGLSRCIDIIGWHMRQPFTIDCNTFFKCPPISTCLYLLKKGSLTEEDQRHLESRKQYYFKCDFWSNKQPPSREQIERLFPGLQMRSRALSELIQERSPKYST